MKKLFLLLVLLVPNSVFAYTGDYCVAGAGTSAVNGTYTFTQTEVWNKCPYVLYDSGAGTFVDTCTSDTLIPVSGYSEIRQGNSFGYYYGASTNVELINTANGDGTSPVPTVTQGACGTSTTTINRLVKFTATSTQTFGDSLFSDDGSNMTLTLGNFFMQIGSLIDTVAGGAFSVGTTNATTMTFGRTGQNMLIRSNVGIATTSPLSLFSIGTAGNAFRVDSTGTVKEGIWNGTPISVASGGTGVGSLTGLLQGNGTSTITAVTGTTGQMPYYDGTNTLKATSTIAISPSGFVSIGTSTAAKMLNLGTDTGTASGSTTIKMGKIQFDGYNSAGARTCMFVRGTTLVVAAGACK